MSFEVCDNVIPRLYSALLTSLFSFFKYTTCIQSPNDLYEYLKILAGPSSLTSRRDKLLKKSFNDLYPKLSAGGGSSDINKLPSDTGSSGLSYLFSVLEPACVPALDISFSPNSCLYHFPAPLASDISTSILLFDLLPEILDCIIILFIV